jgi:hypothetical protein
MEATMTDTPAHRSTAAFIGGRAERGFAIGDLSG